MIDERLATRQGDDLLGILLRAQDPQSGQAMSHTQIADEVLGMIVGGHETSSSALTWAWYELTQHPETLTQVFEEIDQVIGSRPLEIEHIKKLSFTRMVLDEVLRLHPPFWFENRNTRQKTKLAGVDLPAGSIIVMSRYSLHRHRRYWRDPNQFNPHRFQPKHEENPRSSYAYIPFGGGPRICIGTHFAMMEMLVIMALIGRHFQIELSCEDRHEMSAATTMTPKHGVRVIARPRAS
jgi:cytochrome P450